MKGDDGSTAQKNLRPIWNHRILGTFSAQRRHFICSATAAAIASSFSGLSMAQETSRPLRIVVRLPPAAPADMVPRNMQDVLIKLLGGQPVVFTRFGSFALIQRSKKRQPGSASQKIGTGNDDIKSRSAGQ